MQTPVISLSIALLVVAGTLLVVGGFVALYYYTRRRLMADQDLVAFVERVEDARAARDAESGTPAD